MKNIFIPSDFSEQSLDVIRTFIENFKTQRFNIILFHTLVMPDSISDLLFISRKNQEILSCSRQFIQQCKTLKDTSRQINSIQQTLIYGSTTAIFKQYLEANAIDFIVCQKGYYLKKLNKYSFDPCYLIEESGKLVLDMSNEIFRANASEQLVKQIIFSKN